MLPAFAQTNDTQTNSAQGNNASPTGAGSDQERQTDDINQGTDASGQSAGNSNLEQDTSSPTALDNSDSNGDSNANNIPDNAQQPDDTGQTDGNDEPTVFGPRSTLPRPPGQANLPQPNGEAGNLRVLDWAGFRAAVSYTFDDSNTSQIANYNALQALGVPLTFYLITSRPESRDPVWARAVADGHEVANHTDTHLNSGGGNLATDTDTATRFLEDNLNVVVRTMAAPFGANDYVALASTRFLMNRGVNGGNVSPNDNTNPFSIPTFIPATNAQAGAFNNQVDASRNNGSWHTVLVHGFNGFPQEGAFQPVGFDQFLSAVNYAKDQQDVWIDSLLTVGAYWIAQKQFNESNPVTNQGTTTWTWSLPNLFPPNQFLRATVDGGTLSQGGLPLQWDELGFYEISLDAGSLTLTP